MSEASLTDLAARLARIEDERAVEATLYAYATALDYGDREMFLDCFTPEANYVVVMRLGAENSFSCQGREALGSYFDRHTHAPGAYHKHITVNPSVTCDGDDAHCTSYFLRVDASAASGPATVLASGRYLDTFVRDEGRRWRISSRLAEVENL